MATERNNIHWKPQVLYIVEFLSRDLFGSPVDMKDCLQS